MQAQKVGSVNWEAANRLIPLLSDKQDTICQRVSRRLLDAFPEIQPMLKLEGGLSVEKRLSEVSVTRLCRMVQAILLFETLTIADQEFRWAGGVLPRNGVTYQQQISMARWFFKEINQLQLNADEKLLLADIEQHILHLIDDIYKQSQ
jgi:hypothetical protein